MYRVRTVETHRENLRRKLKLNNVADVTKFALAQGWITVTGQNLAETCERWGINPIQISSAGADPQLVIGIRGPGDSVVGHAWVVVDGEPLFEPAASVREYASFFAFGRRGALQASPSDSAPAGDVVAG